MRIIKLYYDVERKLLTDSVGYPLSSKAQTPGITYKENVLVRIVFSKGRDAALEPVDLSTDVAEYTAAIDDDFDQSTVLFLKTEDENINVVGDWETGGDASPAIGQLSLRLDAYNSNFANRLDSAGENKTTRLEIQCIDAEDHRMAVYRMPFYCYNLMDDDGVMPDAPAPAGAISVLASDGYMRFAYYFTDDDTWRLQIPRIIEGTPTYVWEIYDEAT